MKARNINTKSLRYFVKIAECNSLTRAAAELHLTQPALTRHIAQLEHELQTSILMRNGRGVGLTDAGHLLHEHALVILARLESLADELDARETEPHGELTVGMHFTWSAITAEIVERFVARYPDVKINIVVDSSEVLEALLKSNDLDIAVLTTTQNDPEIESWPIIRDRLCLFGPKGSGLDDLPEVSLEELAVRPMITQHNAVVAGKRIDRKLSAAGLAANTIIEASSSVMLDLVERGLGYAAIPGSALATLRHDLVATPIRGFHLVWTWGRLKTRPQTAATGAYYETLLEVAKRRIDAGLWKTAAMVDEPAPVHPTKSGILLG